MSNLIKINFRRRKRLTSVLGLALDGSRLDGVVLRRVNGSLQQLQAFTIALTLDPLTAAPELVGREIRNQLDAAGVRERNCVVAVPARWALTLHTELPQLAEADAASLLQMEAERGFLCDVATLRLANSRCALAGGRQYINFTGISNTHLAALEQVLAAAKLKPLSFALGNTALQPPGEERSNGVLALMIAENHVGMQITAGGGVAALRALEGAVTEEAGRRHVHADLVAREARITMGQLPAELRAAVKRIRIFGPRDLALPLADEMELRFEPLGLSVETVSAYAPGEFGVQLPGDAAVSAAFSLAARTLLEQPPTFEFLPPKPTAIEALISKYSSGKLRTAGMVGAVVLALIVGLFLFQQIELIVLQSQWKKMSTKVAELEGIQQQIRQYRPWFDGTFQSLSILRQLTLSFPEDGAVTAKTVEIHDGNVVTCNGTANDNASLLRVLNQLRAAEGVNDLKVGQIRGKSPMQFSFSFRWGQGGAQ